MAEAAAVARLVPGVTAAAAAGAIGGMAMFVIDAASNGADAFLDKGLIVPRTALVGAAVGVAGWASKNPSWTIAGLLGATVPVGFNLVTKLVTPKNGNGKGK